MGHQKKGLAALAASLIAALLAFTLGWDSHPASPPSWMTSIQSDPP